MNVNIQIGGIQVIIISLILFFLIGVVVFLLVRLNKKIDETARPKFGFLGKTLTYSIITVTLGVGVVIFLGSNLSQLNNSDNRTNANNKYQIDFQAYRLGEAASGDEKLELSAVVLQDGIVWGDNVYDLTWSFEASGSNSVKPITETKRGTDTPSYLVVNLPKDKYSITVKAKSDTISISKTKEIDLR